MSRRLGCPASRICSTHTGTIIADTLITKGSTLKVTGTWEKIEAFERMVRPFGLVEMARTGEIAISRGRSET